FVRYKYKTTAESKERALLYSSFNAKLGLTNSLDVQVMFQTYARQHTQQLSTREKTTENGFGDLTIRLKKNVLGDDGNIAIAILPYVTLPTNQYEDNVQYEGGLIVPVMFKLKNNW
ncbi:MAG: transporter, partial [Sphingobacteriaceae bacterium]